MFFLMRSLWAHRVTDNDLHLISTQPDTSQSCKTTYTRLIYRMVCSLTPQLLLLLTNRSLLALWRWYTVAVAWIRFQCVILWSRVHLYSHAGINSFSSNQNITTFNVSVSIRGICRQKQLILLRHLEQSTQFVVNLLLVSLIVTMVIIFIARCVRMYTISGKKRPL